MRILINQTTRMGDVVQTSPLVRMLRAQHPKAHLAMLVRRMGRTVAERHPDLDEVIVYDEDALYLDLKARDSDRLLRAYREAQGRIAALRAGRFDAVYNVTHSLASAMMMSLAGIPECVGAAINADGQYVLRGEWVKYFFTSVFSRDYNDLNLCDITRNFAADAPPCRRLVFDVREEDRAAARALLASHGIGDGAFLVCMQLGASEAGKRWPAERFAELARLLGERHAARILLVGVQEEAPLGEEFARHAPGMAVPLYGRTSIPELAALLERARLLVTNDTGTMHLAAAVDCPVALVSVGHVHYRETGPYGEGHCAIEARRQALGRIDRAPEDDAAEAVSAGQAYAACAVALDRAAAPPPLLDDSPALAGADLYATRFAPDGFLQFYPVVRRPMTDRDGLRIAYRAMWIEHLTRRADTDLETGSLDCMLSRFAPDSTPDLDAWAGAGRAMFDGLAALAQRGIDGSSHLLQTLRGRADMQRAKQEVSALMALDEAMRVYSELHPPCKPLILMARFERDNLEGADPLRLAEATRAIYAACKARAALMSDKIARVAARWRAVHGL